MLNRIKPLVHAVSTTLISAASSGAAGIKSGSRAVISLASGKFSSLVILGVVGAIGYGVYNHPPVSYIKRGQIGVRINQLTGSSELIHEGMVVIVPGVVELRQYSLLDQLYRPVKSSKSDGEAPFQSIEGLSLGVDLTIRYALDSSRLAGMSKSLPQDINGEIVEPLVQGVIYKAFTRYTVREIFSSKRQEIQQQIEAELKPKLAADGILLRSVMMGKIDLPQDYKNGMEKLLSAELETEKMKYTLDLKDKQVKQTALEAEADKVRRETAAEAAGNEQIIAAKAQEEAMTHVLPFKQKQIEQRQYEAEAEKVARIKTSEGTAQARVIEATGEADSRRKLADAEAYRQDLVGKVASAQLERDGELLTKHPLLIQKTMADKLSDKISVIIAAPPANGGFIGSALLGMGNKTEQAQAPAVETSNQEGQ
ncbi:SPFH domain-containing protein [Solimicrobium silvestre]|uniref:SPFH domain / Band 7 family n=1 Tax=Solimicrobium silvestre TaxID=2099400 RepID=A0A2S9GUG6_9BURK|nr:SPFH domain-containing protein [Solimicrobium silvestre]PRC91359.1 SPFH domain / Band 7 family [Solimicrobium silvestre]